MRHDRDLLSRRNATTKAASQVQDAVSRAKVYLQNGIAYAWGSKNEKLDCSGLVKKCYPMLCDGTERQRDMLKDWLFTGSDLRYGDVGDLVFFADGPEAATSHVGLISGANSHEIQIIHSSEARGGVVLDVWDWQRNSFRDTYQATYLAKMKPFLVRFYLKEEIWRFLEDVESQL